MTRNQQTAAVIGFILLFLAVFIALDVTGIISHLGCCPCVTVTP